MEQNCFLDAVIKRRSIYNLGNKELISPDDIMQKINTAVKFSPSAFNSQSSRVLVLFGDNYKSFWNIVINNLKKVVPPEKFTATEDKIKSFMQGYGTILFFEDENTIRDLQSKYPLYKDNFSNWALQSSGMLQFIIWTLLEKEGLGASLQHYNPLVDNDVKMLFGVPYEWMLLAQMPFGSVVEQAENKSFMPIEDRVKVFK